MGNGNEALTDGKNMRMVRAGLLVYTVDDYRSKFLF